MTDPTPPSTASISDALDRLGLPGSVHGIGPLVPGQTASGPAFTARYEPVDGHGGTVGDFLDDVPEGSIVVIDNRARTDCTVWGGIMTRTSAARGIRGTVIDGVCRDTSVAAALDYPIWSGGRFMRTGKDRVRLAAVQVDLRIGDVTVRPGDLIVGDADGVVVVPRDRVDEVISIATSIEEVEDSIVDAVRSGSPLRAARESHGYHSLQTRPDDE